MNVPTEPERRPRRLSTDGVGLRRVTAVRRAHLRVRDAGGFTLVESMLAIVIMSVGIWGTAQVFGVSLRTANVNGHRTDALTLSVRDIEVMRAIPYAQLGFSSSVGGYSSTFVDGGQTFTTATVPYSQLVPTPIPMVFRGNNFVLQREIYWVDRNGAPGNAYKQTTVIVTWTDEFGNHSIRQNAVIYPSGLGPASSTTTTTLAAGTPNAPNLISNVNIRTPTSVVDLSWSPASSGAAATQWKIQFSTNGFVTPQDAATVAAINTTYKVTGLGAGTVYQFRVGALNGSFGPTWSNVSTEVTSTGSGVAACQILSETITPSTVARNASTHQLGSTPAAIVATTGSCMSLTLRYQASDSNLTVTALTPNAAKTTWTANVQTALEWDLGNHVIAVWDDVVNASFSGSSGITVT